MGWKGGIDWGYLGGEGGFVGVMGVVWAGSRNGGGKTYGSSCKGVMWCYNTRLTPIAGVAQR